MASAIARDPAGAPAPPPLSPSAWTERVRGRHPVLAFLVRRIAVGLLTLLVVSLLIFLATNALPGDVAQVVLGRDATPERLAALRQQLGLDQGLLTRYLDWLRGLLHGDLGQSAVQLAQGARDAPVAHLIGTPLRNSLMLGAIASVLLVPLSLLVGTIAATRAGRATDYAVSYSALVLGSLPEFVLGTFLVLIFFSQLDLLPPVALIPPGTNPLAHPDALALPLLTLLSIATAFSSRQVRAGVIESLRQDYVTSARLGGLRERRVLLRYALRNALAPSVQAFAQTIQYLFGGIIVVEALFAYPGVGNLLVSSVQTQDVTQVQAIAIVLATLYIAINILADLIVVLIVPRLRTGLA